MAEFIAKGVLAAYYGVLFFLALYGLHRLRLLWLLGHPAATREAETTIAQRDRSKAPFRPRVTIQLPIYNERHVATRLLDAASKLDYPSDLLEIQVLDDSNDDTSLLLAQRIEELQSAGLDVRHLQRIDRTGFKAGALEAGLRTAHGELIAVFDADFVPQPDFLRCTVRHFENPEVGMVQAAWEYRNRRYSLLTEIQAMLLDGHFQVEHAARAAGGLFFNFNGTAGVWRRRAIESAGGWQHDTLTEDLDLSYRAQLKGWRFVFRPDLLVPSELPIDLAAFKTQQHRWTQGSAQTLRKLWRRILLAHIPWRTKFEALTHLSSNLCYPLMVALTVLLPPAMYIRHEHGWMRYLAVDLTLFSAASLSIVAFYLRSQYAVGESLPRALRNLIPLMALGIGMAPHNARAALTGLVRSGGVFVRTPKYRIESRDQRPAEDYRPRNSPGLRGELIIGGYLLACSVFVAVEGLAWSMPFLLLFLAGYVYVVALSVKRPSVSLTADIPRAGRTEGSEPAAALPAMPTTVSDQAPPSQTPKPRHS